jgi:CheY-like chemotaxis protein
MSSCGIILYAEDDENDAFFFLTALSKAGVGNPVAHVLNGEEAFSYLAGTGAYSDRTAHPFPCLLITDLKMPGFSGFDLLARAKPILESRHLTALVLSASTADSDKERCLQLGAQAFFVKPPDLNGLVSLAKELKNCWLAPATLTA